MTEDEVLKILGKNVQKQREKINMTIKELSEKTKIKIQYLEKIEKGNAKKLSYYKIYLIAQKLNTKLHVLCEGISL